MVEVPDIRTENAPAGMMPPDARIEDYLDHVYALLVGRVPYARRQELRVELRSHLEALADTHEELGSSRDVAVLMALRQFGEPRRLARQWTREWLLGRAPVGVQSPWRAMGIALGFFGAATLAALGMLWMMAANYPGGPSGFALVATLFLLPAVSGLATGVLASTRHALGTFYALAIILPVVALTFAKIGWSADSRTFEFASLGIFLAGVQAIYWTPIGCLAAALGGSLRAKLEARPGRWVLQ